MPGVKLDAEHDGDIHFGFGLDHRIGKASEHVAIKIMTVKCKFAYQ
jgi:hypothetical protein